MQTFSDFLQQEGRALLVRLGIGRPGGSRIILIHVVLLAVFGVFLPWTKGLEFTDSTILSAYLCMSVVFAAPSAAEAFSVNAPASMSEAFARITVAVLYGEILVLAMVLAGLATVTARAAFIPPDLATVGYAGLLGITASFALAATAAWITLRFSTNAARGALRAIFLVLLLMFFYWSRWLPHYAPTGAVICLFLGLAMLFSLRSLLRPQEIP